MREESVLTEHWPSPTRAPVALGWLAEARATLSLAWPLIIAQFATIALTATDVVMMGWLGAEFIAAGSLATSFLYPFFMFGVGVCMAVSPLVSQALGGGRRREVRLVMRQGLWVALGLSAALVPLLLLGDKALLASGQTERTAALAGSYLDKAAWMLPPALVFVVLRSLVAARAETGVVLRITLCGIAINAFGNWLLMFGNLGLPRMELAGAGVATTVTHLAMAVMLWAHVARGRAYRRLGVLARPFVADLPRLAAILRLGVPIGLTMTAESGLFTAAAIMVGWLGQDALAAHAVALQLAAIAFMAPLGLSHATTVRVGLAHGAGSAAGAARAGWTSILISFAFMGGVALTFWFAPRALIGLFLDPADPANAVPVALAASYLGVAALFQLVDGAQVTAAAALRGMSDTRAPMLIALTGYWVIGLPTGYVLGFGLGLEGVGVWLGLAAGLAAAAALLMARLAGRTAGPG
jgi:MATE family multidrug resistance protein